MKSWKSNINLKESLKSVTECRVYRAESSPSMAVSRSARNTFSRGKRTLGVPTGVVRQYVYGFNLALYLSLSLDIEAVTWSLHVNHISVHASTHRLFTH